MQNICKLWRLRVCIVLWLARFYANHMQFIAEITVISPSEIEVEGKRYACRIGRAGIATDKREGDLKTPVGRFLLRHCYYRPDRMPAPETGLATIALAPDDGWCDDAAHPLYNQHVKLPFAASHEKLWREDDVYDLIIPMGYNDDPITPGLGSAIFMHLMREDGVGTEGCVALKRSDLLALLPRLNAATQVIVPALLKA